MVKVKRRRDGELTKSEGGKDRAGVSTVHDTRMLSALLCQSKLAVHKDYRGLLNG
jgi:hypothetical protein